MPVIISLTICSFIHHLWFWNWDTLLPWLYCMFHSQKSSCDADVNAGIMSRTFDLLLVPEPAQVGGRLAALGDAGQSDVVSLHGGLRQPIDLWLLWHAWKAEQRSQWLANSHTAGCHYATIILVFLIGTPPAPPQALPPAGRLESRLLRFTKRCPASQHMGEDSFWHTGGWFFSNHWAIPNFMAGSTQITRDRFFFPTISSVFSELPRSWRCRLYCNTNTMRFERNFVFDVHRSWIYIKTSIPQFLCALHRQQGQFLQTTAIPVATKNLQNIMMSIKGKTESWQVVCFERLRETGLWLQTRPWLCTENVNYRPFP